MKIRFLITLYLLIAAALINPLLSQVKSKQNWTHFARISGNGLGPNNINDIMTKAEEHGAFGIELDNDITGRYDSFLDPSEKLLQIKQAAEAAHRIGNYAFIYIAGLECITENTDKTSRSMFKDHPDWVQRDINGKPAVFTGGASFWVSEGDEDVWISPYAKEWRKRYMEIVRQIAATGIDGIYIDVAYWMWLYEGWENSWASFDDYTVAEFKSRTGIDAKKDFVPGDFNDPDFLKWVDFRIQTITEFFKEIDENVKSVNPNCLTIPEVSPSVDGEVVRSGTDVYEIQLYSDVIAHEFFINTNTGAKRNTFDWITYVLGVNTLRAFDENDATWLLSYSWDNEEGADARDAMKLLSCVQLMSSANYWDAPGHLMAGSNDYGLRREIFNWIKENDKLLYTPRKPLNPVGVYFSPSTRNYFADDYIKSYYGILHLLLNNHIEFQIITPRTLDSFEGGTLILPDVKILNDKEFTSIEKIYKNDVKLIITGETGYYDPSRNKVGENRILKYLANNNLKSLYLPECPGKKYFERRDTLIIKSFIDQVKPYLPSSKSNYKISASFNVSTQQASLGDKDCIFITNLKELKGYSSCIPVTEEKIVIEFESSGNPEIYYLPYLGTRQKLDAVIKKSLSGKKTVSINVPPVQFGGIIIIE